MVHLQETKINKILQIHMPIDNSVNIWLRLSFPKSLTQHLR